MLSITPLADLPTGRWLPSGLSVLPLLCYPKKLLKVGYNPISSPIAMLWSASGVKCPANVETNPLGRPFFRQMAATGIKCPANALLP